MLLGSITGAIHLPRNSNIVVIPYNGNDNNGVPLRYGTKDGDRILRPEYINGKNQEIYSDSNLIYVNNGRDTRLNVADGAYPVYYTPGNANGHFNGKIYLLK